MPAVLEIIVGSVIIGLKGGASVVRIAALARAFAVPAFLANQVRIMAAATSVDFRNGHDGLATLVKNELHKDSLRNGLGIPVAQGRSVEADREGRGLVMA